ncbi:MAG: hypothetical protein LBT33_08100 [Spirochaetia bacterium]|nr:hypothetical protein [Spirochaetia bacterium]
MPNCKIFPVDYRDIKDRDAVSHKPCGYYFDQENARRRKISLIRLLKD